MNTAKYIALLRGVNVGGKNIIKMGALKSACERQGFQNVVTYINSGNLIFDSDLGETAVKAACEKLIAEEFGLDITVFVLSAADLTVALTHAPEWWNQAPDARHDVFFVIPPMTAAEICAYVGAINEEYEKADHYGRVIFWSARREPFTRTRWSKMISTDKTVYLAITVRNANTALKLAELAGR